MKKFLLFILSCVSLLFFTQSVQAATYYIDADTGNDANAGTENAPWQTLAKISTPNVASGDTVYIKGEFSGGTPAHIDLTADIQGLDADHPTVISNWPDNTASLALIGLSAANVSVSGNYFSIAGLKFDNNNVNLLDSYAIVLSDGAAGLNVEDSIFKDSDHAIKLYNANSDVTINRNEFSNNLGTIYIGSDSENLQINNNVFFNNIGYGIAGNTATNLKIYNNVFYGAEIGVYLGESTFELKNNIFSDIDVGAIGFINGGTLTSDYNIFYNNTAIGIVLPIGGGYAYYTSLSDWQALGYDANSVEADPLFVSTTAGSEDFHLQEISPAIDAGTTVDNETDIDAESRPYTAYDIGADERPVPLAPTDYGATTVSDIAAEVYWTAPTSEVTSYVLYIGGAADLSDAINFGDIMYTTYDMSGFDANTTYYVQLQSKYVTDYQEYLSDYTSIFSFTTNPGKVQNVKVPSKYRKADQVKVKWDSAGDNLTYKVKLMNKAGKKLKIYTTTNLKKTMKNLTAGKTYKVKVRAILDSDHKGEWSAIKKFKTLDN